MPLNARQALDDLDAALQTEVVERLETLPDELTWLEETNLGLRCLELQAALIRADALDRQCSLLERLEVSLDRLVVSVGDLVTAVNNHSGDGR